MKVRFGARATAYRYGFHFSLSGASSKEEEAYGLVGVMTNDVNCMEFLRAGLDSESENTETKSLVYYPASESSSGFSEFRIITLTHTIVMQSLPEHDSCLMYHE